jgi:hypothetical protein
VDRKIGCFQFDPVSALVDWDDPTIRFWARRELLVRSIGKLLTLIARILPWWCSSSIAARHEPETKPLAPWQSFR